MRKCASRVVSRRVSHAVKDSRAVLSPPVEAKTQCDLRVPEDSTGDFEALRFKLKQRQAEQAADPSKMKVAFMGCGAIGSSLLREVLAKNLIPIQNIVVCDPLEAALEAIKGEEGVRTTTCSREAVGFADVVMLCVKPNVVLSVMEEVKPALDKQLFISIAAGVRLDTLGETTAGTGVRWARAMPNVACLVGSSASTYFPCNECSEEDIERTEAIFDSCGTSTRLSNEALLDAATGVAGSGVAFIFMIIEAMADGGVRAGLTRKLALQLASQTVLGAAMLQQQHGAHPGELKDMVCSPGGATIEAVAALEDAGLRAAMIEAVRVATKKSAELGNVKST